MVVALKQALSSQSLGVLECYHGKAGFGYLIATHDMIYPGEGFTNSYAFADTEFTIFFFFC